jgi:hypothetical protein
MTKNDKKILLKCYISKENSKLLNEMKTLYGTKTLTIEKAIWSLKQEIMGSQRKCDIIENVKKKKTKYELARNNPKFLLNKMEFRDTHQFERMINYSYKLLKIHGKTAKRTILKNINSVNPTITNSDIKRKIKEFKYNIMHNFDAIYDSYIETLNTNRNFAKHNKKNIDFSDMVLDIPIRKNKKIKKIPKYKK